jgi:glycosyltransferase involved in cell wall biosynthesis
MIDKNINVIVPVFNESKVIRLVLEELCKNPNWNIIIVNDGSFDNSMEVCKKFPVTIINHHDNLGQGAALRTGVEYSLKNNSDILCTFDSDGQHKVADLENMIRLLIDGDYEIILGSRFLTKKSKMPFKRFFLLKVAKLFDNLFFSGSNFTDVHNGLRVFTSNAAFKLDLSANRMEHASLITKSIVVNRLIFAEYPVEIIYSEYSISKGQNFKSLIQLGFKLLKLKFIN